MARSNAFLASFGRRRDVSTISVRFFDENSIVYFERLLDDRRSLDDTFIVSAMMRDVEKTLKNFDRAHKIRVRRCSASTSSKTVWAANYFENASKNRTQDRTKKRLQNRANIGALDPRKWSLGSVWEALGGLGEALGGSWGAPGEASWRAWGAPGEPLGRTEGKPWKNTREDPRNPPGFECS